MMSNNFINLKNKVFLVKENKTKSLLKDTKIKPF